MLDTFYVITDTSVSLETDRAHLVTAIYSDNVVVNRLNYIGLEVIRVRGLHLAKQIAGLCNYIEGGRKYGVLEVQFAVHSDIDTDCGTQGNSNA